jgi:mRNA-degrading endonuclease toxin of MazEF toxin-antitoxin module
LPNQTNPHFWQWKNPLCFALSASRVSVTLSDPVTLQTGLKSDSVVMTDNLATIELQLVRRAIGRMPRMDAIDQALRTTLAL